jgi:6-phosphogluconolactonase
VANAGTDDSNYTAFRLHYDGSLEPIADSTAALPDGSQPGDVLFNGTGRKLVGTRIGTSLIDSLWSASAGWPPPRGHRSPRRAWASSAASSARRTRANYSCPTPITSALAPARAFRDSFNGRLSSIGSSPFADDQTAPCSGEISRYSIAAGGALTLLGSTQREFRAGVACRQGRERGGVGVHVSGR